MGTKLVSGVNDLATMSPELVAEWSPNNILKPTEVAFKSNKTVEWVCSQGHTWEAVIASRSNGVGCPFCSGRLPIVGKTDLQTLRPDLAKQWGIGNTKKPTEVTEKSSYRANWVCNLGHTWDVPVHVRSNGAGCPVCSGRKRSFSNSLEHQNSDLMGLWSDKNTINPNTISPTSKKLVWWRCNEGHEWEAQVSNVVRGSGCPFCSGQKPIQGETDFATIHPEMAKEWSHKNNKGPHEVTKSSSYRATWICSNGHEWVVSVNNRHNYETQCPVCFNPSKKEMEFKSFVESLVGAEADFNNREVIKPLELDIYVKSKNIAFEFNGLYWHSTKHVDNTHKHYDKWKGCHDLGIQLITVWEDDWDDRRTIVESMVKSKLGLLNETKIGARKTKIVYLTHSVSSEFLNKYHIQGSATGTYYIGLEYNGNLVAVGVFKKSGDRALLSRYATSCPVVGGFTKIMKESSKHFSKFETFADLSVSDGKLYESTGWTNSYVLNPDYKYLYNHKREHKFNFRKKRFRNDPNLLFNEEMTEKELANLNNIYRIYDCGKIKYTLDMS